MIAEKQVGRKNIIPFLKMKEQPTEKGKKRESRESWSLIGGLGLLSARSLSRAGDFIDFRLFDTDFTRFYEA